MTTIEVPAWPWRVVQDLASHRGLTVWLVGGAVRDILMHRPLHDWDFAVDRHAMGLARAVGDALSGFFFVLDEERGTARVLLESPDGRRLELDFALLRGASLELDLASRDFTVNAMAVDADRRLVDPLGGRSDLHRGLIRGTHRGVFDDDPVRLLRAVRLEAELTLLIEPQTEAWIRSDAPKLSQPAAERLRDELTRALAIPGVSNLVRRLEELLLLEHFLPELTALRGVPQPYPHQLDAWGHTLHAADAVDGVVAMVTGTSSPGAITMLPDAPAAAWGELSRRLGRFARSVEDHLQAEVCDRRDGLLLLRLAALLHDIGKPDTQGSLIGEQDEASYAPFAGHELAGADKAASRLRALRFSRDEIRRVRRIIETHLRPASLTRQPRVTRRTVYRYFRDTGDIGVDVALLSLADYLARWGPDLPEDGWVKRLKVTELLLHHYFEKPEVAVRPSLPVDGHDLMRALEIQPGPAVGRLLELVREAVAAGDIETREEALELARQSTREEL